MLKVRDHEWRVGENDGDSVAKVMRFRNNQKIRVSMLGYPMEYYSPNWHHFYRGTASPNEQTYMSRLTPDGRNSAVRQRRLAKADAEREEAAAEDRKAEIREAVYRNDNERLNEIVQKLMEG